MQKQFVALYECGHRELTGILYDATGSEWENVPLMMAGSCLQCGGGVYRVPVKTSALTIENLERAIEEIKRGG